MSKINPNKARKNQNILKILLFIGIFIFAVAFSVLSSDNEKIEQESKKRTKIKHSLLVKEDEMVKTKWMNNVDKKVITTNIETKELKKEIIELKKELTKLREEQKNIKIKTEKKDKNNNLYKNYPTPLPYTKNNTQPDKPKSTYENNNLKVVKRKANFIHKKKKYLYKKRKNTLILDEEKQEEEKVLNTKDTKKETADLVPTGSILKVMLLSGFDAPTLAQAKTNPLPILMKVTDLSILPNRHKYDLKECFVMGEGYGDLSSERAYIRTNSLSCVTNSGKIIDTSLKAFISGEDGKAGLRGRVVSKQGTVIANTIIATFISNVANAFGSNGQSTTITGTGQTITTNSNKPVGEILKNGFYQGMSAGANKLADFFLKMADQVSPVIEISARRTCDVILTAPLQLKITNNKDEK